MENFGKHFAKKADRLVGVDVDGEVVELDVAARAARRYTTITSDSCGEVAGGGERSARTSGGACY